MTKPFEIPRKFYLHGLPYEVSYVQDLHVDNSSIGEISFRRGEIRLETVTPTSILTKTKQEQVYLHELVHGILDHMQSKLTHDDHFVEAFALLLHQALVSSDYPEPEVINVPANQ